MRQNPYGGGMVTPFGSAAAKLMQDLFSPEAKMAADSARAKNQYYGARSDQALADAAAARAKTRAAAEEALRMNTARGDLAQGISGLFGPKQIVEQARPRIHMREVPSEDFDDGTDLRPRAVSPRYTDLPEMVGPMPGRPMTQLEHEAKFKPEILGNYLKMIGGTGGVDPAKLGDMMRGIIMNYGDRSAGATEGAFLGSGDEYVAGANPNALSTERQDALIGGKYDHEAGLERMKQRGATSRTGIEQRGAIRRTNIEQGGAMARQKEKQEFEKMNPKDYTLNAGDARYSGKDNKRIAINEKTFAPTKGAGKQQKDGSFILKKGEVKYDKNNKLLVANHPAEKFIKLKPGETALMANGTIIGSGEKRQHKVGYDTAVIDSKGNIIYQPKTKPLTVTEQSSITDMVHRILTGGSKGGSGGKFYRQPPPDESEILAATMRTYRANRSLSIGEAMADAIKNSPYKWQETIPAETTAGFNAPWDDDEVPGKWVLKQPQAGTSGGASGGASGGTSGGASSTTNAPPPRPANVPPGSAFNAYRQMWRAPNGTLFNADGSTP